MPQLQSVVIVLLKVVLANVTSLVTQMNGNGQNGTSFGFAAQENGDTNGQAKPKGNINPGRQPNGKLDGHYGGGDESLAAAVEELNALRLREISSKAVSGVLLLLLKWFKISRTSQITVIPTSLANATAEDILKYEYMTQLLLDSNYLPLILKFFAHQDIDKAIDHKVDRKDLR